MVKAEFSQLFPQTNILCSYSPNYQYFASIYQKKLTIRDSNNFKLFQVYELNFIPTIITWSLDSELILVASKSSHIINV